MPTTLTSNFRIHNAESFVEGFSEGPKFVELENDVVTTEVISTNIYMTIGKSIPWSFPQDKNLGVSNSDFSDLNPPLPLDHLQSEYDLWRNMISAKRVLSSDVSHVIPRIDWSPNVVYKQYSDKDGVLFNQNTTQSFYVMTDDFHVFKCLFNNYGTLSTVKPDRLETDGSFATSDGYVWKYMYTVGSADAFKFMTPNYIPVKRILQNPGSGCSSVNNQWDVQQGAIEGAIDIILRDTNAELEGKGENYVNKTGKLTSDHSNADGYTLFNIEEVDGLIPNYYKGASIYFPESSKSYIIQVYDESQKVVKVNAIGEGEVTYSQSQTINLNKSETLLHPSGEAGSLTVGHKLTNEDNYNSSVYGTISQIVSDDVNDRWIITMESYNGVFVIGDDLYTWDSSENKTATSKALTVTETRTEFQILPTVNIKGDGTGCQAVPVMSGNSISGIQILNKGQKYTYADVTFTRCEGLDIPESDNIDAVFSVVIPPRGGHGSDPVSELGGFFVMMNTKFEYDKENLPTQNDFRQIGLVRQPLSYKFNEDGTLKTSSSGVVETETATGSVYNQMKTLVINTSLSSYNEFLQDDIITQESTNSTCVIVDIQQNSSDSNYLDIRVNDIKGEFQVGAGHPIESANGSIDEIDSILSEALKPYSGEVLFIEQRKPVQREGSQVEDIKIVLEF